MIGSEPALEPAGSHTSVPLDRPAGRVTRRFLPAPVTSAVAGCFALALISVLVLSWVPSSDPWAWIDWGQEIASPKVALGLSGGPSWKPFPVIFTTVFGFFGGAAPQMWLVLTRTAGLLALVAAFRLGKRVAGTAAGVVAVLALCLTQDWLFYLSRGASEPVVAALTLWAIDRHLSGSFRLAYVLIFLATLNRPEFSPFLFLYGLYLWRRVPGSRPLAVFLLILVPVMWLLPPGVITGNPLQASSAALGGKGSPGSALAELGSAVPLMTVPTLVLAAVGLGFVLARRERDLQVLGVGAIGWAVMVALITQIAYGLPRYLLPAGAIACLLAGVGVVRVAELAGAQVARRRGSQLARWTKLAVGCLVLIATLPWSIPRIGLLGQQGRDADQAATLQRRLFLALDRAGGTRAVLPCRSSHVAVNHTVASALAWKMKVPLRRVRAVMRGTGFVFRAPHFHVVGTPPVIVHAAARRIRTVAAAAPWVVLEVTIPTASAQPHCALGDQSS